MTLDGFFEYSFGTGDIPILITLNNNAQNLAIGVTGSFHATQGSLPMNPRAAQIIYVIQNNKFNVTIGDMSTSEWTFEVH